MSEKTSSKPQPKNPAQGQQENTKAIVAKPSKTPNLRRSIFFLYIAVAVLLGVIIWQWQVSKQHFAEYETLRHAVAKNVRQVAAHKPLLDKLETTIASHKVTTELLAQLQDQVDVAAEQLANLQRLSLRESKEDWILLEVEYRVNLARIKLNIEHDPKTAAKLLAVANNRLAMLGDSSLNAVRQALNDDLLALNSFAIPDLDGAVMKLQSLSKELGALPFLDADIVDTSAFELSASDDDTAVAASSWRQHLHKSLAKLSDMVRIRKRATPLGPLYSPKQERLILQNMQLMLHEAELLLLQSRAELYKAKLQELQQWLEAYFAGEQQAVIAFNAELVELANFSFATYPTNLDGSVRAVKEVILQHFSIVPKPTAHGKVSTIKGDKS